MFSTDEGKTKTMSVRIMNDLSLFAKVVCQHLLSEADGWPLESLDVRLLLAETDDEILEIAMERRLLLNHRLNRVIDNMVYLSDK